MCHTRVLQRTFHGPENPQFRFKQLARQEPAMQSNFACKSQRSFGESPSGPSQAFALLGKSEGEKESNEQCACLGRNAQGSVRFIFRRQTEKVESQRPSLCGLGNLPLEGFAGGPEPNLRLANQRLVRPDRAALR